MKRAREGIETSFFKVSAGAPTGAEAPPLIEGTRAGVEMTVRDVTPDAVSLCRAMMRGNSVNAHRLRYESTSPTAATVRNGRSSGDDALWPDIAYSDVVRVWPTQDSTIGLAQDQSQAVHRKDGTR